MCFYSVFLAIKTAIDWQAEAVFDECEEKEVDPGYVTDKQGG